jgi:hypothetical protein
VCSGEERASRILLDERTIDLLGEEGASSGRGLLLDGAASALGEQGAAGVLGEEGALGRILELRLKKVQKNYRDTIQF